MIDWRKLHRLAAKVRPDYALCVTEDCPDRELTDRVKWVIDHRLRPRDRDMIILYTDRQSYREVGREIGCSRTAVQNHVRRIRDKIFDELEKI